MDYKNNFIDRLKSYADEFIDTKTLFKEWKYIGNDKTILNKKLFLDITGKKFIPDPTNKCICGHYIKHQYWIMHTQKDIILTVGDKCITKIMNLTANLIECKLCHNICIPAYKSSEYCRSCHNTIIEFSKKYIIKEKSDCVSCKKININTYMRYCIDCRIKTLICGVCKKRLNTDIGICIDCILSSTDKYSHLRFGKYSDCTYEYVIKNHIFYCLELILLNYEYKYNYIYIVLFLKYLWKQIDYIIYILDNCKFTFGKYIYNTYKQIYYSDTKFCHDSFNKESNYSFNQYMIFKVILSIKSVVEFPDTYDNLFCYNKTCIYCNNKVNKYNNTCISCKQIIKKCIICMVNKKIKKYDNLCTKCYIHNLCIMCKYHLKSNDDLCNDCYKKLICKNCKINYKYIDDSCIPCINSLDSFRFGKYSNHKYDDIINNDLEYCIDLMIDKKKISNIYNISFINYFNKYNSINNIISKLDDDIIDFGKHENAKYIDVFNNDMPYCEYLMSIDSRRPNIRKFCIYIKFKKKI
ncbi:hypothetical protein [Alphaentomopoxvirus acuprea]|uniref:Uncharacterized protein n=1 Tax=Alphaentomopoxvirus acuprea TaxID=62099 RepID=W6JL44_9POXV|nr:hypothetical protein BA82_gp200 [Anomala cuprea entomopoxvirus]BAO49560.1 hypothetical protein [Anomala cuprea entomopoxvirus]